MSVRQRSVQPIRPVPSSTIPLKPKTYDWADVKTYSQGWTRVQTWLAFGAVFLLHGSAMILYELKLFNVEDEDSRDMLADQVLTLPAVQRHHQFFRVASWRYTDTQLKLSSTQLNLTASEDLPMVVYEWSRGRCTQQVEDIPCFATDHAARAPDAGPLNDGTDVGNWAYSATGSVTRTQPNVTVTSPLTYKYHSFASEPNATSFFGGNMSAFAANLATVPAVERTRWLFSVPVPIALASQLDPDGSESPNTTNWAVEDWYAYMAATWDDLQTVTCPRSFDLCEQTFPGLEAAAFEVPGSVQVLFFENDKGDPAAPPTLSTYRYGEVKRNADHYTFNPSNGGYVDKQKVMEYVRSAIAQYPADSGYIIPTPSLPLSSGMVTIDQKPVELQLYNITEKRVKGFVAKDLRPLWFWPQKCQGTGTIRYFLHGTHYDILRPAFQVGENHMISVGALREFKEVPLYSSQTDFDKGTTKIASLSKVEVFVAFAGALGQKLRGECCAWTLNHVAAFYGDVWEGPLSEAANQFPSATVSIEVVVRDVSEPPPTRFPEFTGNWRILAAIICGGVFFVVLCSLPWWALKIHEHVTENNNLPPLFYRHNMDYRGW